MIPSRISVRIFSEIRISIFQVILTGNPLHIPLGFAAVIYSGVSGRIHQRALLEFPIKLLLGNLQDFLEVSQKILVEIPEGILAGISVNIAGQITNRTLREIFGGFLAAITERVCIEILGKTCGAIS